MSKSTVPYERQILSVSQLNRTAKDLLEGYLPLIWVEGELSNFARPSSGHWYFTLKDQQAQVRCAMFKNRNNAVRFAPQSGEKVLLRAKVSLYEGRGDYQLIAEHLEPAGAGDLQRQFELIKLKLEQEGLFAPEHKKPLPRWPQRLGVITSPSGAAIHDILQVLKRRFPSLPVVVLPVAVQGAEAPSQIVQAIKVANSAQSCDLLIIARGGGSLEDLWAFNDEQVARTIAQSRIPIVSAVGHEVDFTIADFVADLRAPTPSAAAELVSPDGFELRQVFDRYGKHLKRTILQNLQAKRHQLQHLIARLRHPGDRLAQQSQALDRLEIRLIRAWHQQLQRHRRHLATVNARLTQQNPNALLKQKWVYLNQLTQRLRVAQNNLIEQKHARFLRVVALLNSLSPLNTLKRGYAIVQTDNGEVVRRSTAVNIGQRLQTRLGQGGLTCEVIAIHELPGKP